jgi:8-oxo-dGTP pyrophosphatase MutT (NUDIX family)
VKYTANSDVLRFKKGEEEHLLLPEYFSQPYRITDADKDGYCYVTKKNTLKRIRLGFPKGSLSEKERETFDYNSAIVRECIEEAGVDCSKFTFKGVRYIYAHDYSMRYRAFLYETPEEVVLPAVTEGMVSGEVDECCWMSIQDMQNFDGFKNIPMFEYFKKFCRVSIARKVPRIQDDSV